MGYRSYSRSVVSLHWGKANKAESSGLNNNRNILPFGPSWIFVSLGRQLSYRGWRRKPLMNLVWVVCWLQLQSTRNNLLRSASDWPFFFFYSSLGPYNVSCWVFFFFLKTKPDPIFCFLIFSAHSGNDLTRQAKSNFRNCKRCAAFDPFPHIMHGVIIILVIHLILKLILMFYGFKRDYSNFCVVEKNRFSIVGDEFCFFGQHFSICTRVMYEHHEEYHYLHKVHSSRMTWKDRRGAVTRCGCFGVG